MAKSENYDSELMKNSDNKILTEEIEKIRCKYFLKRKKRFCKATARIESKFCVEHGYFSECDSGNQVGYFRFTEVFENTTSIFQSNLRKRIICPLDSKQ